MKKRWLDLLLLITLGACRPLETASPSLATATIAPSATPEPTATLTPTTTPLPPTQTATEEPFTVCSPLEDESLSTLPEIMVNPLVTPAHWGQDFGHPGLDFAYYRRGERTTIQGVAVYAILSGTTVLTLENHYPYGYAILIETPLKALPEALQAELLAGYASVPEAVDYQYNCPNVPTPEITGEYSLYHIYAHLEEKPTLATGDTVACGMQLGTVGNTGYSSNPHLHLETRLGPSGLDITTMAHYETAVTEEQLSNYCLWRSSGYYQIVDPFLILNAAD